MAILRGDDVCLSFGTHVLLDNARFSLEHGEKVAIIGRNGAGKSSLLKLISSFIEPDGGLIQHQKGLRVRYLSQKLPEANESTVFDIVAQGVDDIRIAHEQYMNILENGGNDRELTRLHDFLDATDGWHWQQKVEVVLTQLNLDGEAKISELSGGWRRRVALGECLASSPELLLLDEPTNHLDLETIEWLEESLKSFKGALLLISHDRQFIDAVVDKVWEIDRGILKEFPAPYDAYLEAKEKKLEEEAIANAEFDKKLAQEEVWIRQGIKARRTRNEGRVRTLKKLRDEKSQRREIQSTARLNVKSGKSSGKLVAKVIGATLAYGEKRLFTDFDCTIMKGDKIGVVGKNGCGKSSLIKMILGEVKVDSGSVELGTQLDIAYFDQMRSVINPELTISENIGEGRDFLEVGDEKRHVISYLSDYGFSPERMRTPASALSGGEVSRLMLAKLFTKSSNLLILDEPTNDLDIDTLELLESQIVNFNGTVIVISHDRRFLDNVVSSLLVFDEEKGIVDITGGYSDYARYRKEQSELAERSQPVPAKSDNKVEKNASSVSKSSKKKLSYKFQRELETVPKEIEALENRISELEQKSSDSNFFSLSHEQQQSIYNEIAESHESLEKLFERWEELESMSNE